MRHLLTISLASALALAAPVRAQPASLVDHVVGRGVAPAPLAVSADVYPAILAEGGVGGTVGAEAGRWHVGAAAFSVRPPAFVVETFFRDTDGVRFTDNDAVEAFVRVYPRPDRRGLYAELIGGPEWFEVEDEATGATDRFVKAFVVPKAGVRALLFGDRLSVDAAAGYAVNLGGTGERAVGSATFRPAAGGFLPFLQVGTRVPIGR